MDSGHGRGGDGPARPWLDELERAVSHAIVAERLFGRGEALPTLGPYRVLRRIGAGAHGVVFEGQHAHTAERVALKVLRDWHADSVQRLKREFRSLRDVLHPNLVQLRELYLDAQAPFLAMELIEGSSLAAFVRADPGASARRLLSASAQLIDAIGALHAADVTHRDIKPSNLMIGQDGRLVVLDFGLARSLADAVLERSSEESGTLHYMAPERLHLGDSSRASDWYSVGVIVTELLPGVMAQPGAVAWQGELSRLAGLCRRLLAFDPSERPDEAELRAFCKLPARPSPGLRTAAAHAIFAGRAHELSQLRAAFTRATRGDSCVVRISGAPGVGKSALVAHFLTGLSAETPAVTVLTSRCHAQELIPYNALDGLVEGLSQALTSPSMRLRMQAAPVSEEDAAALCRLFPVLNSALGRGAAPIVVPVAAHTAQRLRGAAFRALRALLQAVADAGPLVMHLDDLHWGDADSAHALRELLAGPGLRGVLLIACYRDRDSQHSRAVHELTRCGDQGAAPGVAPTERELVLDPLDPVASMQLATALAAGAVPKDALAAMSAQAAGSPLFLRLLVQHHAHIDAAGTPGFPELLGYALQELTDDARRLLQLSALAGCALEPSVLTAALGAHAPAGCGEHLLTLQRRGLLRSVPLARGAGLECYHDRIRETVAHMLDPEPRRALHAMLADAAAGRADADPEFLALQNEAAGRLALAAHHAERAGDRAADSLALEHAAALYARALRCHEGARPPPLIGKLAEATAGTARCAAAVELFLEAAERATGLSKVRLRMRAAEMLLRGGSHQDSARVFEPLLRDLKLPFARSRSRALLSFVISAVRARVRSVDTTAKRRSADDFQHLQIEVSLKLGFQLAVSDPLRGGSLLLEALRLSLVRGSDDQLARALGCYASMLISIDHGSRAHHDALLAQAACLAEQLDSGYVRGWVRACAAMMHYHCVDLRGVVAALDDAQRLGSTQPSIDFSWFALECETQLCGALALACDVRELDRRSRAALEHASRSGNVRQCSALNTSRMLVLLARDDPDAAQRAMDSILAAWPQHNSHDIVLQASWAKASVLQYHGRDLEAWHVWEHYRPLHVRAGYSRMQPWATLFPFGEAQLAIGCLPVDPARYTRVIERAIAALRRQRGTFARYAGGVLQASLAQWRGDTSQAVCLFERSGQDADALGLHDASAAVRYRRAQLLGEPLHEIEAWFARQGVANASRWVRLTAPLDPRSVPTRARVP